jgi:hypothetical protein
MDHDLAALTQAVAVRDAAASQKRALDVRQWSLDLQLRYRPVREIDIARFRLWLEGLRVDLASRSTALVGGDVFALDYIRDRIVYDPKSTGGAAINERLGELQVGVVDSDYAAMTEANRKLLTARLR